MNLSLSFLATERPQLPTPGEYGNNGVEAVLFTRMQLETQQWEDAWENVKEAVVSYGPEKVTFHFPVDECDYIADQFVSSRLSEAYSRAGELGLAGLVVHSNRIRTADEWKKFDQIAERSRVFEKLTDIRSTDASSNTWLGLENMPLTGNFGQETDPLFSAVDDFRDLPVNLGIVWDVCHAMCSTQVEKASQTGSLPESILVRMGERLTFDPSTIGGRVMHWHFSAFKGLNNPDKQTDCIEGVLPSEGDLPEQDYETILRNIKSISKFGAAINFEVQEDDYVNRKRGPAIIGWAKNILGNN